jgi:hypothetical protein
MQGKDPCGIDQPEQKLSLSDVPFETILRFVLIVSLHSGRGCLMNADRWGEELAIGSRFQGAS